MAQRSEGRHALRTQRGTSNLFECREQNSLKFYWGGYNRKFTLNADMDIMLVYTVRCPQEKECGTALCRQDFLLETNE